MPSGDCNPPGGLVATVDKYYWDNERRACFLFKYLGCPGSNVFDSELDCQSTCQYTCK